MIVIFYLFYNVILILELHCITIYGDLVLRHIQTDISCMRQCFIFCLRNFNCAVCILQKISKHIINNLNKVLVRTHEHMTKYMYSHDIRIFFHTCMTFKNIASWCIMNIMKIINPKNHKLCILFYRLKRCVTHRYCNTLAFQKLRTDTQMILHVYINSTSNCMCCFRWFKQVQGTNTLFQALLFYDSI